MTADSTVILKELQKLNARLSGLTLEMAVVRETPNIQFKRMTECRPSSMSCQRSADAKGMRASAPRPTLSRPVLFRTDRALRSMVRSCQVWT